MEKITHLKQKKIHLKSRKVGKIVHLKTTCCQVEDTRFTILKPYSDIKNSNNFEPILFEYLEPQYSLFAGWGHAVHNSEALSEPEADRVRGARNSVRCL